MCIHKYQHTHTHICKWVPQSKHTHANEETKVTRRNTHAHSHKHMLINRKQTVTQAVCRDWIILCLSLLNKLLSKFNQTHQSSSVGLWEAVISVVETEDEKKDKTQKRKKHRKEKKKVSALNYSENCLFVRESWQSAGTMSWLSAIDICLQRASGFKLPQKATSSMGAALWKLQPSVTRIQNT